MYTMVKLAALGAALFCSAYGQPHIGTSLDRRDRPAIPHADSPDDFYIDDKWQRVECVSNGVMQNEFIEADKSFREWMNSPEPPMLQPKTKVIHRYGYTQVYVCTYAGQQPVREHEYEVFLKNGLNKCHGDPGMNNNDRGAKLWFSDWNKEYGFSSTGYDPCPKLTAKIVDRTPRDYTKNPLADYSL